ncbi:DEKNAAC104133 [Brettanomyces naardenensis]|uniref:DEKNAAC104133 n=1 Tax=Brettanomyces naardenensis TaxID=13370 RepID=A0A448YPV6_BRENA|nr:DEKNAAC104133 [Brettanomyces naardenensis]
MGYKGNIKPKRINTEKSSDRRLASGYRPNTFMRSNQDLSIKDPRLLEKSVKILNDIHKQREESRSSDNSAVERIDPKTGKKWYDSSLVDWNPSHFRLFVGNLGPDVTEELLFRTFIKYPSLSKVKIPKETKKDKSENKGYGFVSFADADDYLHCFKEMNGKYVGSKPIALAKAKTEIGRVVKSQRRSGRKDQRRR